MPGALIDYSLRDLIIGQAMQHPDSPSRDALQTWLDDHTEEEVLDLLQLDLELIRTRTINAYWER